MYTGLSTPLAASTAGRLQLRVWQATISTSHSPRHCRSARRFDLAHLAHRTYLAYLAYLAYLLPVTCPLPPRVRLRAFLLGRMPSWSLPTASSGRPDKSWEILEILFLL